MKELLSTEFWEKLMVHSCMASSLETSGKTMLKCMGSTSIQLTRAITSLLDPSLFTKSTLKRLGGQKLPQSLTSWAILKWDREDLMRQQWISCIGNMESTLIEESLFMMTMMSSTHKTFSRLHKFWMIWLIDKIISFISIVVLVLLELQLSLLCTYVFMSNPKIMIDLKKSKKWSGRDSMESL